MRIVCGLDVHKDSIYLCILSDSGEIFERVFGVLTTQLHEMHNLMLSYGVNEVSSTNGVPHTWQYLIPGLWFILLQ